MSLYNFQLLTASLTFVKAIKKPIWYRRVASHVDAPTDTFYVNMSVDSFELTTTLNGEVETVGTAKLGDVIMTGADREQYIVSSVKFPTLYDLDNRGNIAIPKPLPRLVAQATDAAFKKAGITSDHIMFWAPWGEKMLLKKGDYLVNDGLYKYYRIEQSAFKKTYTRSKSVV